MNKGSRQLILLRALYLVITLAMMMALNGCNESKEDIRFNDRVDNVETSEDESIGIESNDDSFTDDELDDMEAVDNAISDLLNSIEYNQKDLDGKAELVEDLLKALAKSGTTERNHSLIKPLSIHYYKDSAMYSFEYKCGVEGGIMLQGFDSMFNGELSMN